MSNGNLHPSFSDRIERSPEFDYYGPFYPPLRRDISSATPSQSYGQVQDIDWSLDSAFSRLHVSDNSHRYLYSGDDVDFDVDVSDGSILGKMYSVSNIRARGCLPSTSRQTEQNNIIEGLYSERFDDYRTGLFTYIRETCLTQHDFLLNPTRLREANNGFLNETRLNQTGFVDGRDSALFKRFDSLWSDFFEDKPFDRLRLEDFRGQIVALAKDQDGSRFLQREIGEKNGNDMIYKEVINHLVELAIHPCGNYVIQKLVEDCNQQQRTRIFIILAKNKYQFLTICCDMHGTRVVQKLLENFRENIPEQISVVMSAIWPVTVSLMKNRNGYHVIDNCLKYLFDANNRYWKYLLHEVADKCLKIATDKSGCCVLQSCVKQSQGEERERLASAIISNALFLAVDSFGNYVVQLLLELRVPQITESLLGQLEGSFASLSCNRFGSHVVEKCLTESGVQHTARIIFELLQTPDISVLFLDPSANYVIQCALTVSEGQVHENLLNLVRLHASSLRCNMYGKGLLTWLDRS